MVSVAPLASPRHLTSFTLIHFFPFNNEALVIATLEQGKQSCSESHYLKASVTKKVMHKTIWEGSFHASEKQAKKAVMLREREAKEFSC